MFAEPDGATPLDPDEMQGLKFKHVLTRGELNELEQANIEQGLAWVSRQRGGSIFDDGFIRKLHKKLFGDVWTWAGEYRLTEKNIGIDPLHISMQLRLLIGQVALTCKRIMSAEKIILIHFVPRMRATFRRSLPLFHRSCNFKIVTPDPQSAT